MARATYVRKARKDIPAAGIKAGESYYWWKFRRGGKHFSRTPPKRSQLTQSEFLSQLYEIEDDLADAKSAIDDCVQRLHDLADECEEKRSNMPESLQDSGSGQLLEERAQACNDAADSIEGGDLETTIDIPG